MPTNSLTQTRTTATPAQAFTWELVSPKSARAWARRPVSPPQGPILWGNSPIPEWNFSRTCLPQVRAAPERCLPHFSLWQPPPKFPLRVRRDSQPVLPTFGLGHFRPAPPESRRCSQPVLPTFSRWRAHLRILNDSCVPKTYVQKPENPGSMRNMLYTHSKSLMTHAVF